MTNRDRQVLEHILVHCEKVARSLRRFGYDYDLFCSDNDYCDSVSMKIFQIGELSKLLTDDFVVDTLDEIPWNDIKGMRNFFAHEYADMDIDEIWNTATRDIPGLERFCLNRLEVDDPNYHLEDVELNDGDYCL